MENKNTVGIGFCEVLAIVFVVLKLVGVINWSWVWVLAPMWIPLLVGVVLLVVVLCINGRNKDIDDSILPDNHDNNLMRMDR